MSNKIITYVKAHPYQTGAIVIIGGIIFIMIVRGSGGGGDSGSVDSGPSDAEIMANAQIQAAQIQMQGAIQGAQVGAGVQLNSDNKAAEVAMAQIEAQKALGLAAVDYEKNIMDKTFQAQQDQYNKVIGSLGSLKKKNRDDVLQALITGQPYYAQKGPGWGENIGNAAGGIGKLIGGLGSIFSDQRLKENITLVGQDARGRNVYEYNYKGSATRRRGYIAQDLERSNPEITWRDPDTGFVKVDQFRLATS